MLLFVHHGAMPKLLQPSALADGQPNPVPPGVPVRCPSRPPGPGWQVVSGGDAAEQAQRDHDAGALAKSLLAAEGEASALRSRVARHAAARNEWQSERDRLQSVIGDLKAANERMEGEARDLEARIGSGSAVERPWMALGDGLLSWVNANKGGKPFSGKEARVRALAWCAERGDIACAELWARSPA